MRKLLLSCVLSVPALVGLASVAYPQEAEAMPPYTCTTVYYSQPDYWDVVGEDTLTCIGNRIQTGSTSPYYEIYCEPC
jgi:hypothetical protein